MKRPETSAFLILAAWFAYDSFFFRGFIQDDAYIFARYARHIASGDGFVYNAGEYAEGATSLLWTLFAALAVKAGADVPLFLKTASLAGAVLWLCAFFLVCRQWLARPWQWLPPVALFAFYPAFSMWSQAGLEVCFFGFLLTAGFYLAEAWHREGDRKHLAGLCATAALLILTRPEGLPVAALYGVYLFLYPYPGKKDRVFRVYLPVAALTLAGLLAFRYSYFGDFVPNTYYAKSGGGYPLRRLGLAQLHVFLLTNLNIVFFTLCLPVLFMRRRIRLLVAVVPLWAAYYVNAGGDILPQHRLLLPAVPFMLLGTFYFFERLGDGYSNPRVPQVLRAGTALAALALVSAYRDYRDTRLLSFTGVESALERAHGGTGRYLDSHMKPGDTAILTDAGMTAYYAPGKHLVDWLGLCDKRTARILYTSGYNPWAMFYCTDPAEAERRKTACFQGMAHYFEELAPRYAVLNIILKEGSGELDEMLRFYRHLPDTLNDFVTDRISFDGYFGIFTRENRAGYYRPVSLIPYNPTFWILVAERPVMKKPLEGMKGF